MFCCCLYGRLLLSFACDAFEAGALDIRSCCLIHVGLSLNKVNKSTFLLLNFLLSFLLFFNKSVSLPDRLSHRLNIPFFQHLLIFEQFRLESLIRVNNRSPTSHITDSLRHTKSFLSHQVHQHESCRLRIRLEYLL